jgi:Lrp/AsnC family transcriptional regulator for asnA, asnC and gidA
MRKAMDHLDWEIIKTLRKDSRTSNVAIARELGVSEGMVRQRIFKLRSEGIIQSFTITTSSRGLKALIEINIEVNVHTTEIARRILALQGIEKVYEISGDTDIIALVDVTNTKELNEAIEGIRAIDDVTSTRTKMVLGEL